MKQLETNFTLNDNTFTQVKRNGKAAIYKRETLEGHLVSYEVFAIKSKDNVEVYPNQNAMSVWAFCPISPDRANTYFDRITNGDTPIPNVDPITGETLDVVDNRSLDELPDGGVTVEEPAPAPISVSVEEVEAGEDPTVVETEEVVEDTVDDVVGGTTPVEAPTVETTPDGGAVVTVAKVRKARVTLTMVIPSGEFTQAEIAKANGLPERGAIWGKIQKEIKENRIKLVEMRKVGKGRPTAIYAGV